MKVIAEIVKHSGADFAFDQQKLDFGCDSARSCVVRTRKLISITNSHGLLWTEE